MERLIDSGLWVVLLFSRFGQSIIRSRSWRGRPIRLWSVSFASRPRRKSSTLTISRIREVVTRSRPQRSRSSSTERAISPALSGSTPASKTRAFRIRSASQAERSSWARASTTIRARSVDSSRAPNRCR